MRYKAREAGLEGVAWYCESCGAELFRHVFDTATTYPQEGYLAACELFNADAGRRTCGGCAAAHPSVDVEAYRWPQLAEQLRT
jgi:3-hydroxyanthranilate 3,4-dioxygenase